MHVRKQLHYYYFLGRGSIMQLLKTDTLLDLLDLIQEYPSHLQTISHYVSLVEHECVKLSDKQRNVV